MTHPQRGDALTAVPLGIAFVRGRRAATRCYTYGYGRAEDLASISIVLSIAASTAVAAYEGVDRLRDGAAAAVTALGRLTGTSPMLLTGDNPRAAAGWWSATASTTHPHSPPPTSASPWEPAAAAPPPKPQTSS